jgi:hypothetical protein
MEKRPDPNGARKDNEKPRAGRIRDAAVILAIVAVAVGSYVLLERLPGILLRWNREGKLLAVLLIAGAALFAWFVFGMKYRGKALACGGVLIVLVIAAILIIANADAVFDFIFDKVGVFGFWGIVLAVAAAAWLALTLVQRRQKKNGKGE